MRARMLSWVAWGSVAASAAMAGVAMLIAVRSGSPIAHVFTVDIPANLRATTVLSLGILAFPIVGALIATRRPENPIGWVFCAAGAVLTFGNLASTWEVHALETNPGSLPGGVAFGLLSDTLWLPSIAAATVFLFALFPTGRPAGRLERIAIRAGVVAVALALVGGLTEPHLYAAPSIENPLGLSVIRVVTDVVAGIGFALLIAAIVIAVISLVLRYRAARGEERLQLKWFVVSASLVLAIFVPSNLLDNTPATLAILGGIAAISVPVSVGIAILRYRLYDIDVVLNKAVVYGALALFISGVYVAIVVGIGSLVGQGDRPNVALSIVATAIVAVAAQPVRARMQRVANRVVYGERASPYEVLTNLAERVGATYATEDVLPRTARVIAEGVGAASAEVWVRSGDGLRRGAMWPAGDALDDGVLPLQDGEPLRLDRADRTITISHGGEILGAIAVTKQAAEPLTPAEDKLLEDLASQAGLVLRNVGLTTELQARLDELTRQATELRASRQRIVAAQDAERKRLERNIHDGAQQHLVALAVKLRLAKGMVITDPAKARTMLDELRVESGSALETLRDLARGIYPPILEEQGLVAALQAQVYRGGIPVRIDAEGLHRHPIDIEGAVYFSCLEALQNAAKYSEASGIVVELHDADEELSFTVRDDGRGFDGDQNQRGSGLSNMADRVAAIGGQLEVHSQPGAGTTVTGRVPLGISAGVR